MKHTPPLPYFGSKRQAAAKVWEQLGDPAVYLEPFAGSLAVLLARPDDPRAEVAVDTDGLVLNLWRAIKHDHEGLLGFDMGPVSESEIEAMHQRLIDLSPHLNWALRESVLYYDMELAYMYWAGISSWIGAGWCSRSTAARQRPHIDRTLKGLFAVGCTDARISLLAERLANVVLLAGDWTDGWKRCVSDGILNRFRSQKGGVGIFLDPPYTHDTGRTSGLYEADKPLSEQVSAFALVTASADIRIVVAGYESEYPALDKDGWVRELWNTPSGYVNTSGNTRREQEVLFVSPEMTP
jgi:site-specific DNA-adenine methylase